MGNLTKSEWDIAVKNNQQIFDEHFDVQFCKNLSANILDMLDDAYFRTELIGFDEPIERNNPNHPVILASNHSGMSFPWDAVMFLTKLFKKHDYDYTKTARTLVSPMLSQTHLMNLFQIKNTWKRAGGIDATYLNFETIMQYPRTNVLVYPEGVPGIGKGFNRRYELQRLATSFIKMSIKYKTDIVPFATVNAEYLNPHCYSFPSINNISKKLGIPFLPMGLLLLLLPFAPWLFYYAMPAKMTFVRGRRISPYEWTDKEFEDLTQDEINEIRDRVRNEMQGQLSAAVEEYGQKPYKIGELFSAMWKNLRYFPYYFPPMWPFMFLEFNRLAKKHPNEDFKMNLGWGSWLRIIVMNPMSICYFIPIIGWIPILINGYRENKL